MTRYKDFFKIDEKYRPMMTREALAGDPDMWLNFFPHSTFIGFLRSVLQSLEGGRKSVWLTGPYGTGKTFAALVLQKLLNATDERVNEWFTKRKEQFTAETIGKNLQKFRKYGILAVFDTGSDAVGAKEQFLVRIEQAIVKELQERQLVIPPKGNFETIVNRVKEEGDHFFQTRDSIQHRLAHLKDHIKTFANLKKDLENENLRDELLSDTLTVLRERSIYLDLSSQSLLNWIDNVLQKNGLSKLVFIWDEFASFIDKNRSELKTLEELAEAAQQGRFYFIPVTHMKIDAYLAAASESAKKANDRFEFKALDMPNDTAFRLAADAFQIIPEKAKEWEQERIQLWHGIKGVVDIDFREEKDIQEESFKNILPIHPMAAFVLKHLATLIGSNQRSLFAYLKSEAEGSEFHEFIESGGPTVTHKQYLTVDYLWKYFVERDDLGQDKNISEVKAEYIRQSSSLQPEEQRVFKTVLLFSLLSRLQSAKGHQLLQPTIKNIVTSFVGDGEIRGVEQILKQLEQKHCFSIVNDRCEMFRSNLDESGVQKEIEKLRDKFNTLVLAEKTREVLTYKIKTLFNNGERFVVRVASVDSITMNIQNRDWFAPDSGNQILVQFILAKDEDEKLKIPEKILSLAKHFHNHRIVFLTMETTFCDKDRRHWDEYVDQWARKELATDQTTKSIYEKTIAEYDEQWRRQITDTNQKLIGYKPIENNEPEIQRDLQWSTLKPYLLNFVKQTLPECVDDLVGDSRNAFDTKIPALKLWAESGIYFEVKGVTGQVIRPFKTNGISGNVDWFEKNPQHSLTKIRDKCLKRLDNTVGKNTTFSLRKLYIELQRPPFGLRCVPYSAFILGFVLKEFLHQKQPLQWTNGQITKPLDSDALVEIIGAVVSDDGANKIKDEKLLCRLSKEEKTFVELAGIMFGCNIDNNGSVDNAVAAIQERIETVSGRVPLWCLPDYL
ncbi:MAG: hypothetical protein LBG58_15355 [Planctomycetaceae bacterium]|jgi:hypothetical protein|nr:hypothetical protein [Planctomycetaceae bacterium]